MAEFVVHGPIDVPIRKIGTATFIDKDMVKQLLKANPELGKRGCYIFSWKASRGSVPIYVGKTQKSNLIVEAFNPRNLNALNEYMNAKKKGCLQLSVVCERSARGRDNVSAIGEIEEFLIARAVLRNRDLINVHGTGKPKWSIRSVFNSGRGKPDEKARSFKTLMGL